MTARKIPKPPPWRRPRHEPTPEQQPPEGACAIVLTKGWVAWVDAADYDELGMFSWHVQIGGGKRPGNARGIARRAWRERNRTHEEIMHRRLLPCDPLLVDHIRRYDHIKVIDNRRSNLRSATHDQNNRNTPKQSHCTSIFKGVSTEARIKKWRAVINPRDTGKEHLGFFYNEGYAALMYDLRAVALYGDRALTNFPVPGSTNWLYGE